MEVLTLLETIEEMLEKSASIPLTKKALIDRDEIIDVVKEIKLKLPDELKQAKWVKEERQKILVDAQKEANQLIKEAENRIISMIDEHEITKKAYEQKAEIIDSANAFSKDLIDGTKKYADEILAELEANLQDKLTVIKENRSELRWFLLDIILISL